MKLIVTLASNIISNTAAKHDDDDDDDDYDEVGDEQVMSFINSKNTTCTCSSLSHQSGSPLESFFFSIFSSKQEAAFSKYRIK